MSEQNAVVEKMREYLREHLANANPAASHQMAVGYWGHAAGWKEVTPGEMQPTGVHSEHLVSAALERDCAAWDAACRLSAFLLEKGQPLPPPLAAFTAKLLRGQKRPPERSSPWVNLSRDLPLCLAIRELLDAGFKRTENSEPHPRAIDCVAGIAKELGYSSGVGDDNLEKIWQRYSPHVRKVQESGPFYFHKSPGALPINYPPSRRDRPRR